MANIQEAINQASEAAAAAVASASTDIVETTVSPAGEVTPLGTGAPISMATVMASTSVIPRGTLYLKVNEFGMRIGKNKEFLSELEVDILMEEKGGFQVKHTLRFGNPATYLSTYDGVSCDKGGSWQDAHLRARQADPSVEPYPAADIVMVLKKAVKLKEETISAGTKIALNTSKSNFSEWSDFYAAVAEAGALGETVTAKLGAREINSNGNTWGVVTFELL